MSEEKETAGTPAKGEKCKPLSDTELNEIARKVLSGHIIPSWTVPQDLWISVYMPLIFLDPDKAPSDAFAVLGDMEFAGPMAVNGFPIFSACQFVNHDDAVKIDELARRMDKALKGTMPKAEENKDQEQLPI